MGILELCLQMLQAFTGIASIIIAYLVYKLTKQQKNDSWLRTFNQLHESFWNDDDLAQVRAWLACDQEYKNLEEVLKKRMSGRSLISPENYKYLESLDKFFNFLTRSKSVNPAFKRREVE